MDYHLYGRQVTGRHVLSSWFISLYWMASRYDGFKQMASAGVLVGMIVLFPDRRGK